MKMAYISHPYTGNQEKNTWHAIDVYKKLTERDQEVCYINPLDVFGNADEGELGYCQILAFCMELLSRCDKIVLCPGWEDSTGCRAEYAMAIRQGIEIDFYHEEEKVE